MTTLEKLFNPTQRQRMYEAIPTRYSCRSYVGAPSTADWASLSYAAERFALPGARLLLHTVSPDIFTGIVLGYGKITGCTTIAVLAASIATPHSRIHAGILGEAFCLEATALGLGTCWVAGTYKKKQLALPLQADETVLAIIAVGVPERPPRRTPASASPWIASARVTSACGPRSCAAWPKPCRSLPPPSTCSPGKWN